MLGPIAGVYGVPCAQEFIFLGRQHTTSPNRLRPVKISKCQLSQKCAALLYATLLFCSTFHGAKISMSTVQGCGPLRNPSYTSRPSSGRKGIQTYKRERLVRIVKDGLTCIPILASFLMNVCVSRPLPVLFPFCASQSFFFIVPQEKGLPRLV